MTSREEVAQAAAQWRARCNKVDTEDTNVLRLLEANAPSADTNKVKQDCGGCSESPYASRPAHTSLQICSWTH